MDSRLPATKRNAVAGDDSTSEQPVEKVAKNEEKALPDPSPPLPPLDVEDLRRKFIKTQNLLKYESEAARKLRAEQAKSLLGSKPARDVADWNALEKELKKSDRSFILTRHTREEKVESMSVLNNQSDLENIGVMERSSETERRDKEFIDELNAQIIELRRNEDITKKKMHALLQANASIGEQFRELRKKAKASKDSGEREAFEEEISKLKEGIEMEKRKQSRTSCRELALRHENIELKKKLDETKKRNEHFTGGMAYLLAQCGIPQPQPLPMLQPQQQQPQLQPDLPSPPSSSIATTVPRNMIMSRRIVDEITVDRHGSCTETSVISNESLVPSANEKPPGERQREKMNDEANAPPPTASDYAELQEKLNKSEDKFKRVCRAAGEAQLRAEQAEKLLDAKREVLAESPKRLAELEQENAKLKRSLEEAWRKVDAVRAEEGLKNWQLQQQLQAVMLAGPSSFGTQQWMPTAHPAGPFAGPFPGQYAGQYAGPYAGPYVGPAKQQQLVTPKRAPKLAETPHPTNILEPCLPSVIGAIPFDSAIAQIEAKYNECRMRGLPSVSKLLASHFKHYEGPSVHVICSLCDERIELQSIFFHFKSHQHKGKARAHNSAVSVQALRYWLRKLQRAADTAAAEIAAAVVVADAAGAEAAADGAAVVAADAAGAEAAADGAAVVPAAPAADAASPTDGAAAAAAAPSAAADAAPPAAVDAAPAAGSTEGAAMQEY